MSKFQKVFRVAAVAGILAWAGAAAVIPAAASITPAPATICASCL
jgi:hypothetical protein